MAGSVSRGSMRGGRGRRAMADINVVPYIDVMLVLLIIFMVAAPLTTPGNVDLPSVAKSAQAKTDPVTVVVAADRSVSVKDARNGVERKASMSEVPGIVRQMQGGDAERPVVIYGDKKVEYDAILQVMDGLKQQGVARVGLAVRPRT